MDEVSVWALLVNHDTGQVSGLNTWEDFFVRLGIFKRPWGEHCDGCVLMFLFWWVLPISIPYVYRTLRERKRIKQAGAELASVIDAIGQQLLKMTDSIAWP